MTAGQVEALVRDGYHPREYVEKNPERGEVLKLIESGAFSRGDRQTFKPLLDSLLNQDPFLVLADYQSYVNCQGEVSKAYRDEHKWTRMSILNIARSGKFSSDRAVHEYREKIWRG